MTPIVRIPELTYAHVAQSLDGGAQAIMLPRVVERAQVEECVRYMKYAPEGRAARCWPGTPAFKAGPLVETLAAMNNETMLVVQVETKEAVERLDDLLSVPGVDAALIGPTDLSLALGVGGQMEHPALVAAIEATMAACARHQGRSRDPHQRRRDDRRLGEARHAAREHQQRGGAADRRCAGRDHDDPGLASPLSQLLRRSAGPP